MKQKVIATRVSGYVYDAIAAKASAERVSMSAIAARLLSDALKSSGESPDLAARVSAIEQRLSQIEALGQSQPSATLKRGKRGRR
jgi:hypothetical protein